MSPSHAAPEPVKLRQSLLAKQVLVCACLMCSSCTAIGDQLRQTVYSLGFIRWVEPPAKASGLLHTSESAALNGGQRASGHSWTGSSGAAETQKEPPLTIAVQQAFFVGENLNIKLRVSARAEMSANDILVGVRGLVDGQITARRFLTLSQVLSEEFVSADNSYVVSVELPAAGLTEYQVVCAWGMDAKLLQSEVRSDLAKTEIVESSPNPPDLIPSVLNSSAMNPSIPGGEVRGEAIGVSAGEVGVLEDVSLEETRVACKTPPCDFRYTVRARFINKMSEPVARVKLAVGIKWAAEDKLPTTPPNFQPLENDESAVELTELNVPAGGSKRLKIGVDRAIPDIPGGRFFPYIRLVGIFPR